MRRPLCGCISVMLGYEEESVFDTFTKEPSPDHLRALLTYHQGRAFNICYQLLHGREDAEDAAQESLIKLIDDLPRIRTSHALRHWLYRICLTKALHLKRGSVRRQSRELRYAMLSESLDRTPEQYPSDERTALFQALERLEEEERGLLMEHYFDKIPLEQIAQRDGISRGMIWKKAERARQNLRQSLVAMGAGVVVPDPMSLLEACQPIALSTNLVPGAMAHAASGSVLAATYLGGTVVATKGTYSGMIIVALLLALSLGGTAGYMVRRPDSSQQKLRELEDRMIAMNRDLAGARAEAESLQRVAPSTPESDGSRMSGAKEQTKDEVGRGSYQQLRDKKEPEKPADRTKFIISDIGQLAELLGLDSSRAALLENAYGQAQESLSKLEVELAKVELDGTGRRIMVAPAGDRGKVIQEVWKSQLATILTASEREKYDTYGDGAIFVRGFGETQREIELRRDGDKAIVSDDDGLGRSSVSFPDYDTAADFFQKQYAHFMK